MSFRPPVPYAVLSLAALIASGLASHAFAAAATASAPEKRSLQLSRQLKGISDSKWTGLAGDHAKEKYEILKGDTLFGISKRLFGDPNYWPKIWEINNENIRNPHFIYPGRALVFTPGTATSLPTIESDGKADSGELADDDSNSDSSDGSDTKANSGLNQGDEHGGPIRLSESSKALTQTLSTTYSSASDRPGPVYDERTPHPPSEWKRLPRQTWESVNTTIPPTVDRNGFDSRTRINVKRATGFFPEYLMACEPLNPLGKITGGREGNQYLDLREEIAISSSQTLETGQTYSIVGNPVTIESDGRKMESYAVSGEVKVLGVNDGTYLGELRNINGMTERGDFLVPKIPRIQRIKPIAGPSPIEAKIIVDRRLSTRNAAQYKWVYIDRGVTDGIQPGMVFRMFQYEDPHNGEYITKSNMLVAGDVEVYAVCGNFSLGQVIWSKTTIEDQMPTVLLTDVQDYYTRLYLNGSTKIPDASPATAAPADESLGTAPLEAPEAPKPEGDWLDKLDNGQGLTSEEDKELKQLEKVDESAAPAEQPGAPKLPGEQNLAPAPADNAPVPLPNPEQIPLDTAAPAMEGVPVVPSGPAPSDGGGEP